MAWYNTGYLYKKTLTISHTLVSGGSDLANFPLLLSLTDSDLLPFLSGGRVFNSSGYDIIFVDATETTKLDHEIASYNAGTSTIKAWVRIPTLSASVDTVIYLYFGNGAILSSQENKAGVWDIYMCAVWHLSETLTGSGQTIADSTGNRNATSNGTWVSSQQIAGQSAGALSFDGTTDYLSAPNYNPSGNLTFSAWINIQGSGINYGRIIANGMTNKSWGMYKTDASNQINFYVTTPGGGEVIVSAPLSAGWHRCVGVYDGAHVTLYIDGVAGTPAAQTGTVVPTSSSIEIGGEDAVHAGGIASYFQGYLDEMYLAAIARTAGWIATEYANQTSPASFLSEGTLSIQTGRVTFGMFYLDNMTVSPNGQGYYVQARQFGTVKIAQNIYPVARYEGVKKSGQFIGSRAIKLLLKVVGSSRPNLEAMLDVLYQALNISQQQLRLHQLDGRYYVADALYEQADLGVGNVIAVPVPIEFICQQPYAVSPTLSIFDTGSVTATGTNPNWTLPVQQITGGGTVFARPTITITNKRNIASTQLTSALTSGTAYTSLSVNALGYPLYTGDTITLALTHTPPINGDPKQAVIVAANASVGATTISVQSFIANANYPINSGGLNPTYTQITLDIHWDSITLLQQTDNQYWNVAGLLCPLNNEYLLFTGDPTVGVSVIDSASPTTLLNFTGTPLTLNPTLTPILVTISSPSVPVLDVSCSWNARYLS